MQNSWMKIAIGRIINMLAVIILLFGHISTASACSSKQLKSDKSLKFYKLELSDDEGSFLEDEEEEEEEDFSSDYFILHPFQLVEFRENVYPNSAKQHFYNLKNQKNTSLPLWLEVRHILI